MKSENNHESEPTTTSSLISPAIITLPASMSYPISHSSIPSPIKLFHQMAFCAHPKPCRPSHPPPSLQSTFPPPQLLSHAIICCVKCKFDFFLLFYLLSISRSQQFSTQLQLSASSPVQSLCTIFAVTHTLLYVKWK